MRALLLTVAVVLTLTATGCVEPSSGTPSSEDLAVFGVESSVTVEIDEDGFEPSTIEIDANSTITATNVGSDQHGIVELDTAPERRIETGDLVPGESVDIHIADPGDLELSDPRTGAILTVDVGPAQPAH